MRVTPTILLLAAPLLIALPAQAAETDNPSKALYLRYCGACHGPGGKGDGIAGTFMRPKPTDLTQLAKKAKGEFPFLQVMEAIDGRNSVQAHGDPDMPVWGEIFQEQSSWDMTRRAEVRGKLMVIADYLRSVQEK
jgi:mono/diheme cytochrome c family protein